jgi:hypothetical protein
MADYINRLAWFVRLHQTLRISQAMAAGATSTLWTMEDVIRVVDE